MEFAFDSTGIDPQQPQTGLPEGQYKAIITESDYQPNKNGTGDYLRFVWTVTEGQFLHRGMADYLNIVHANAAAEEIAKRKLAAICLAVGKQKFRNTMELHGVPVLITVGMRKDGSDTEIKRYDAVGQKAASSLPVEKKVSAPAAKKENGSKPPWAK